MRETMKKTYADRHFEIATPATTSASATPATTSATAAPATTSAMVTPATTLAMATRATTSATTPADTSAEAQATSTSDATTAGDALGTATQARSQKRNAGSNLTSIGRYTPAESKRRVADRVLKGLQEGTELLVGTGNDRGKEDGRGSEGDG